MFCYSSRGIYIKEYSYARAGIIGAAGTIVGNAGVNISQMQVPPGIQRGGNAMMVICLDEPLAPEPFRQILEIPGMERATPVYMG